MMDDQIRNQIRERFGRIARSPASERVFPVGPASAKNLGYDSVEIAALPSSVTESFSGVGNPLSLGELAAGQIVLDPVGCHVCWKSKVGRHQVLRELRGLRGSMGGRAMVSATLVSPRSHEEYESERRSSREAV
jgi:hypothetical protein